MPDIVVKIWKGLVHWYLVFIVIIYFVLKYTAVLFFFKYVFLFLFLFFLFSCEWSSVWMGGTGLNQQVLFKSAATGISGTRFSVLSISFSLLPSQSPSLNSVAICLLIGRCQHTDTCAHANTQTCTPVPTLMLLRLSLVWLMLSHSLSFSLSLSLSISL